MISRRYFSNLYHGMSLPKGICYIFYFCQGQLYLNFVASEEDFGIFGRMYILFSKVKQCVFYRSSEKKKMTFLWIPGKNNPEWKLP